MELKPHHRFQGFPQFIEMLHFRDIGVQNKLNESGFGQGCLLISSPDAYI